MPKQITTIASMSYNFFLSENKTTVKEKILFFFAIAIYFSFITQLFYSVVSCKISFHTLC